MALVAAFLVAALTTSAAFTVPDDKAAFSALAHELLNVKPGTSRVDADGIPVVPLSLVDVTVTPASLPIHARVAYGTRPQTEAHFSWTSFDGTSPATVLVGTHSGDYELEPVTAASPLTYGAGDTCGPMKNWKNPGFFHHALLTGLQPSTRYYVRPVQNGTQGNETSFVTGKPLGADHATRFVMFGDMYISSGEGAAATCKFLTQRITGVDDLDFLIHIGDLGYGRGDVAVWNTWHDLIAPFSARIPYHVSIGNHEYSYKGLPGDKDPSGAGKQWAPAFSNVYNDGGGECGVPTSQRFKVPLNGNGVFWYSFDVGNVHVAMISSEHDPSPDAPMGEWLEDDLLAVDRAVTPWIIVAMHRPLIMTQNEPGEIKMSKGTRAILEPLMLKARVDVVMAGHIHSFQRTCPMVGYECAQPGEHGVVYYMNGAAGMSFSPEPPEPSTYVGRTITLLHGYSIVETPNATAMHLQFINNHNNTVSDDFWIYKS